jgi:hypothetical protein
VYGEACGSASRPQRISVRLLVGVHPGLQSQLIQLKRTGGKSCHNSNTGMLERVDESFRRCLHYCIDSNGGQCEHFV